MDKREKFEGCIVGEALGDALGFLVEAASQEICKNYVADILKHNKIPNFQRGAFEYGQYSDDTQLARDLMRSYVERKKFDPSDYAQRIADIFTENRIVGRGLATEEAAFRIAKGINWQEAGTPPPSAGNGTAMRAAPIGLIFSGDDETIISNSEQQSIITHKDKRCTAGSIAIAAATNYALHHDSIDVERFCQYSAEQVESFDPILAEKLKELPRILLMDFDSAFDILAKAGQESLSEIDIITPFVTPSVLWSIYAFLLTPDNYWESICKSIECGGDVDTTAAMTGAISGTFNGIKSLPEKYTERLNDQGEWTVGELKELADNIFEIVN
jgi:ADP-ribosylglycohydrolase